MQVRRALLGAPPHASAYHGAALPHRCGERSWVPKWDDGNVGEALRIGQVRDCS